MKTHVLQPIDTVHVIWNKKKYLFFGGYDYHRLSVHPDIADAVCGSLSEYGLNCGGSRVTTGNHPLHVALEERLSEFLSTQATALLPTGSMANFALFEALSGEDYLCYFHPESHPSLTTAIHLSALPKMAIPPSLYDLNTEISWNEKKPLIVTDGCYGSLPPLVEYDRLARDFKGLLVIDEAHPLGILGKHGKGAAEHFGLSGEHIILTGSLSKALAASGGFVSGPEKFIEAVRNSCTYGTTSAIPLPLAAAGIAALDHLGKHPEMIRAFQKRCLETKQILRDSGYDIPVIPTPAIGICLNETAQANRMKEALENAGIYPSMIRYPGKSDYFRFALSSAHSDEDVDRLVKVLQSL